MQIKERTALGEPVLVTTLTKRLAEDLSFYLVEQTSPLQMAPCSELDAFGAASSTCDLGAAGRFDALVGVNLLREGLDLPEVSMVAIMDADKEGFLRSETSLMQTIGRAARHVNAKVILYADRVTDSMQRAIEETGRRRRLQEEYNTKHGITPTSIRKAIRAGIEAQADAHARANAIVGRTDETQYITEEYIAELEAEMMEAAKNLEFERAAKLRDQITKLRDAMGKPVDEVSARLKQASRDKKQRRGGRVPRPKRAWLGDAINEGGRPYAVRATFPIMGMLCHSVFHSSTGLEGRAIRELLSSVRLRSRGRSRSGRRSWCARRNRRCRWGRRRRRWGVCSAVPAAARWACLECYCSRR